MCAIFEPYSFCAVVKKWLTIIIIKLMSRVTVLGFLPIVAK